MNQRTTDEVNDFKKMPEFVEGVLESFSFESLAELIPEDVIKKAKRVILTGNGDSYCASLAARIFVQKMFDLSDVHVERSIDVGRHFYFSKNEDKSATLVFVTSSSGTGARVTEAIGRAGRNGCTTFAVTTNAESNIGKAATYVLNETGKKVWSYPYSGQSFTYVNAMLNIFLTALYAGVVRGVITRDQEKAMRAELLRYISSAEPCFDSIDEQMFTLATEWQDTIGYDFVGTGSDIAAAYFGAAKFFEYLGSLNQYTDSEDWCHINFFMRDREKIGTIVVASKNSPSFGRTVETIGSMLKSGRRVLVVSEADKSEFPEGVVLCNIPDTEILEFKPYLSYVPLTLLGNHLAKLRGLEFFAGGFNGPLFVEKDMNKLKSSFVADID